MLYKTGVEYGDYTMNHVFGCLHECKYLCNAFLMAKRFGKISSYDEIKEMSLAAIKKLNDANIKCTVLTKGVLPKELSTLSKENEYGITLISLDEEYRKKAGPGEASYQERLLALQKLHDAGYQTWVSIEPYPTPNLITKNLVSILERISFTYKIIFGRTNYSKEITSYKAHKVFYNEEAQKVIDFCKERYIDYHIKDGTIKVLKNK